MIVMNKLFCEENIKYTGKELSPHWIMTKFKLFGDSIVSFVGEVKVPVDNMVDVEDRINNEPIYAKSMLNFIIEHFDFSIKRLLPIMIYLFMMIVLSSISVVPQYSHTAASWLGSTFNCPPHFGQIPGTNLTSSSIWFFLYLMYLIRTGYVLPKCDSVTR